MLGAIADVARNVKTGSRTAVWMKDLINAYKDASRTPSCSPESSPRDSGKGRNSKVKSRAEIFAAFGLTPTEEKVEDAEAICDMEEDEVIDDSQDNDSTGEKASAIPTKDQRYLVSFKNLFLMALQFIRPFEDRR